MIIRQRVRARLGGRPVQQESVIQTKPRNSQDEYVRFSAVNQDNSSRARQRTRPSRTRVVQSQQQNSPIQTEGQEYVRVQSGSAQTRRSTTPRTTTSTSRTTTTSTTSTEEHQDNSGTEEQQDDYGFIRSPNHKPVSQQPSNHKTTSSQVGLLGKFK